MVHKPTPAQRAPRRNLPAIALNTGQSLQGDIMSKQLDRRVQKALELLHQYRLASPMRLADIAATVHVSGSHLRHLFKRGVGISMKRYKKSLQLQGAKELLETSFLSVKEVMAAVGFSDLSHFVREYKMAFGQTPSETRLPNVRKPWYRKRARKNRQ
jgi:AraC family transcriptional regulator, glycine betaine-responsive activator